MTEQEIKDYIVNLCKDSECRYLTEDNECIEAGICFEVKETCVKALNKQIAKKPNDAGKFADLYIGLCPICNEGVNSHMKYCDKCGNKLDWGNEDDRD
jgi:hypothetical protein